MERKSFPVRSPGGKHPALVHWVVCLMPGVERGRVNSHTVNQEPGSLPARRGYLGYESETPSLPAARQDLAPQQAGSAGTVGPSRWHKRLCPSIHHRDSSRSNFP